MTRKLLCWETVCLAGTLCVTLMLTAQVHSDPRCPTEDTENATLIPNPLNCSTYFMCDHGHAVEMACGGGLYFNPELGVCDFPSNVDCEVQTLLPLLMLCPQGAAQPTYYPDPYDCKYFYECDGVQMEGTRFVCPTGLYFNPENNVCDQPENVDCKIN